MRSFVADHSDQPVTTLARRPAGVDDGVEKAPISKIRQGIFQGKILESALALDVGRNDPLDRGKMADAAFLIGEWNNIEIDPRPDRRTSCS